MSSEAGSDQNKIYGRGTGGDPVRFSTKFSRIGGFQTVIITASNPTFQFKSKSNADLTNQKKKMRKGFSKSE